MQAMPVIFAPIKSAASNKKISQMTKQEAFQALPSKFPKRLGNLFIIYLPFFLLFAAAIYTLAERKWNAGLGFLALAALSYFIKAYTSKCDPFTTLEREGPIFMRKSWLPWMGKEIDLEHAVSYWYSANRSGSRIHFMAEAGRYLGDIPRNAFNISPLEEWAREFLESASRKRF